MTASYRLKSLLVVLVSVVFSVVSASATDLAIVHNFGATGDGFSPGAALVEGTDGNFYGSLLYGPGGSPAIFKMTPDGTVTTLHSFPGASGNYVSRLIQGRDGNFYGTTRGAGGSSVGTIFKMTPAGAVTILHSLPGIGVPMSDPPAFLVQGRDGNFYGTTPDGGTYNSGSFFRITPAGAFTILHSFHQSSISDSEGGSPEAGLVLGNDGNFYGTTSNGGFAHFGTVFKVTPEGTLTTLHEFDKDELDGITPITALTLGRDGNFYGTTSSADNANASGGIIFQMTPAGQLTILYYFSNKDDSGHNLDGARPSSLVQGVDGEFYGTTSGGGDDGYGTIFKVTVDHALTVLHSFTMTNGDGAIPADGLIQSSKGDFYGTTSAGGSLVGTVYKFTPSVRGIDVSDYQGSIKWSDVAGAGKAFAFVKASSGLSGTQANFRKNMEGASGAGVQAGAYHFSYPGLTAANTGSAEAQHFAAVAGDYFSAGFLRPVLDIEDDPNKNSYPGKTLGKAKLSQWVRDFAAVLKSQYGVDVILYCQRSYAKTYLEADLAKYAYWVPTNDGNVDGTPSGMGIFGAKWAFKQYRFGEDASQEGTCPGVPAPCDLDSFNGTRSGLDKYTIQNTLNVPVITSAGTASSQVRKSFSYQITARNRPSAYTASGLPAGLKLDSGKGLISGTPTTAGKYTVTLMATNDAGTGKKTLTLSVLAPPVITSAASATANVDKTFSYQITATNSPTGYTASSVPPGLSFSTSTGKFSGKPTKAGTYKPLLSATNKDGTGSAHLTLTVKEALPVITSSLTASARVGTSFAYQITATNDPTSYAVNSLPPGLSFDKTSGKLSGKPTKAGTYRPLISATNSGGTGSASLNLAVK